MVYFKIGVNKNCLNYPTSFWIQANKTVPSWLWTTKLVEMGKKTWTSEEYINSSYFVIMPIKVGDLASSAEKASGNPVKKTITFKGWFNDDEKMDNSVCGYTTKTIDITLVKKK